MGTTKIKAKSDVENDALTTLAEAGVNGLTRSSLIELLWKKTHPDNPDYDREFGRLIAFVLVDLIERGLVRRHPEPVASGMLGFMTRDMLVSLTPAEWSRRLVDVALAQFRTTEGGWGSGDGLRAAFEQVLAGKVQ